MKTPDQIATLIQAGCHTGAMNEIANLHALAVESRWIPVTERVPSEDDFVIFFVKDAPPGLHDGAHFGRRQQHFAWDSTRGERHMADTVTHWMPCPDDPE
jgi:hypothetical protein